MNCAKKCVKMLNIPEGHRQLDRCSWTECDLLDKRLISTDALAQSFGRSHANRPIGPLRDVGSSSIQVTFFLLTPFTFISEQNTASHGSRPPSPRHAAHCRPPPFVAVDSHRRARRWCSSSMVATKKSCQKAALCRHPCWIIWKPCSSNLKLWL